MPHRTDISSVLIIGAGLFLAAPAGATVVMQADDGCTSDRDLGEIELSTAFIPTEGDSCVGVPARRLRVRAVSAYWASREVPVMVTVKRDRAGYRLIMSSMLWNRRHGSACWSEQPIPSAGRRSPGPAWSWVERAFDRWASTCSTTLALGVGEARRSLAARQFDFEQGFARLARIPASRFGQPEQGGEIGTFHPKRITQGLLDAVADACEGPRERLRLLAGGAIAWAPDDSLPVGPDGSLPFDSCVDRQIRYFPGYPKRD